MALTVEQRQVWLSQDFHRIVIADIQYHDGNILGVERFSSYPYVMPIDDTTSYREITDANNLISFPEDFTDAVWEKVNLGSVVPNAVNAPDGTLTADKIILDGSTDPWVRQWYVSGELVATKTYTNSFWARIDSGQPTAAQLFIYDTDLSSIASKVLVLTTEWQLFTLTHTFPSDTTGSNVICRFDFAHTNVSGNYCYLWGAMLSNGADTTGYQTLVSNLIYDDIISNIPNIISRIDQASTLGAISLLNTDGEYDYLLNDVTLVGHTIRLFIGDTNWPRDNFIPILDGIINSVSSTSPENIQITLRDRKETLNVPLQIDLLNHDVEGVWETLMDAFAATNPAGLIQGTRVYSRVLAVLPEDIENTHVPICLGKCFNIEPVLVDSWNHVYMIHTSMDATIDSLVSVNEVRSNGIPLNPPGHATPQYEVDLSLGVIRLLDHPSGTQITCDVVAQAARSSLVPGGSLFLEPYSAAWIIEWLLLEKADVPFDDLCQLTFPPSGSKGFDNISHLGIYYKDEQTVLNTVTNIINSVGGFLRFKDEFCKLQLIKLIDPATVLDEDIDLFLEDDDIIENGVSIASIEEPKKAITLGYRKNWKTQDEGSLAQALTDITSPYYNIELLAAFKNDYATLYELTGILDTEYPLAEEVSLIETTIYETTDAQAELDRRIVLRNTRRRVLRINSLATSFTYDIGDIVYITHSRFGLRTGKKAIIIGIEESPTSKRVNLDVWL